MAFNLITSSTSEIAMLKTNLGLTSGLTVSKNFTLDETERNNDLSRAFSVNSFII